MPRALPFHARNLFALLKTLGWSQKRCAAALGVVPQVVNDWAKSGLNVPVRSRGPLASLVKLRMHEALDAVHEDANAHAQLTQTIDHYITQWFFENLDARGQSERWHDELGRKLALFFKPPFRDLTVDDWRAELVLHLAAANRLRRLIQRHELGADVLEPSYRPEDASLPDWFWHMAEQLNGAPLEESAELQDYETREFEEWIASLPAEKQAGLEAMRNAAQRRDQKQQRPSGG